MIQTKEILTQSGHQLTVDTSDETCLKWGVKAGMRINTPCGKATVLGAGIDPDYEEMGTQMWCLWDKDHGAMYWDTWDSPETFKSEGFSIIK